MSQKATELFEDLLRDSADGAEKELPFLLRKDGHFSSLDLEKPLASAFNPPLLEDRVDLYDFDDEHGRVWNGTGENLAAPSLDFSRTDEQRLVLLCGTGGEWMSLRCAADL
jgi:hypothetical protein